MGLLDHVYIASYCKKDSVMLTKLSKIHQKTQHSHTLVLTVDLHTFSYISFKTFSYCFISVLQVKKFDMDSISFSSSEYTLLYHIRT